MCGMTRAVDVAAAVAAGADGIGVILVPSKRQVSLEHAGEILRDVPPAVVTVGVFVNPELEELLEAVRHLGLDAVQLHGSESVALCRAVPEHVTVVKAFRVAPGFDPAVMEAYRGAVKAVLLDTFVPGEGGGTGEVFDWSLIAGNLPAWAPVLLAGGLTPENVGEAIRTVRPYAVDVSSGVEDAPGIKNHDKIERFVAAARAADMEVSNV